MSKPSLYGEPGGGGTPQYVCMNSDTVVSIQLTATEFLPGLV